MWRAVMPRAAKRALERPTEVKAAVDPARTARRAATELMVIFIVQLSNCGWPFMLSAIILRSKIFRCAAGRGAVVSPGIRHVVNESEKRVLQPGMRAGT